MYSRVEPDPYSYDEYAQNKENNENIKVVLIDIGENDGDSVPC